MSPRQRTRRVKRLEHATESDGPHDLDGLTPAQLLLAAARMPGLFEEIARRANEARTIMVSAEENEARLRAELTEPEAEPSPEAPPPQQEEEQAQQAPEPPAKTPSELYWEEKCRWRFRTAEDYAEWESNNEVEHEYDPFKDA